MSSRDASQCIDLVTGASGFIGSHLALRLLREGRRVRVLCRRASEAKLPAHVREAAEILFVDLLELSSHAAPKTRISAHDRLSRALEGVSRVFHCTGHVSDWGPEERFRALNVEATRSLLQMNAQTGSPKLARFVHLSSIAAFGTPSPPEFDDFSPLGSGRDPYSRTKAEGERAVLDFHQSTGLPVTVIRPAVVYGSGGTWLEEPLQMVKKGKMFLLAGGRGTCHPCYIENLLDALLLAADHPRAIGQAYIVADDDPISFREFFDSIAGIAGKGPIRKSIPLWAARVIAAGCELQAGLAKSSKRPLLTQAAIDMVTTRSQMSMKKIREELGFQPRYRFSEAIRELRERIC